MKKISIILLFILLTTAASATTIESEEVKVDLATGEVDVKIEVEELTSSSISYTTNYNIENVNAEIDGEEVDCEVEKLHFGSEISCETDKRQNFSVEINFSSANLITERQNARVLRYSHPIYRPTKVYKLRVLLPAGTGLLDENDVSTPVVSPAEYETGSDGKRIFVKWTTEPELGDNLNFQVLYDGYSESGGVPSQYVLLLLAASLIGAMGYITYRRINRENIESIYDDLSEDEKDIMELLRESEGEMLQKDVVDNSTYSKAKISGVVSKLVEKDIITKEKEGRSNKLKILDKYSY